MIFEIKNLTFSYDNKRNVLNNANLEIEEGELVTFLGRNGSGKSTLFSLLMGLNNKYDGSIKLNNREIKTYKNKDIALNVGFVPQNHIPTFGFNVFDYVLLGRAPLIGMFSHPTKLDEEKATIALSNLGIIDLSNRDYSELSGGEMQIVTIARALVNNPKVLIFDEPTAHLDFGNQIKVLKTIKDLNKKGYTILISSHDPNQAFMLGGSVAIISKGGKIEKGLAKDILNEEKLSSIYETDIKIRYNEEFKQNIVINKI